MSTEAPAAGTTQTPGSGAAAPAADPNGAPAAAADPNAPAGSTAITGAAPAAPKGSDDGSGKPGEPGAEGKPDGKPAVPEKYVFKFPEGIAQDDTLVTAFDPVMRELGLTNEQAQKLADVLIAQDVAGAKAYEARIAGYAKELATDSEIGGANAAESTRLAQLAFQKYGTPELRALLLEDGLGNRLELVRFFSRVGKTLSQDSIAGTTAGTGGPKSTADVLYGR